MSATNDKPASSGLPLFRKIRKILRMLVAIFDGGRGEAGCGKVPRGDNGATPGTGQGKDTKPAKGE